MAEKPLTNASMERVSSGDASWMNKAFIAKDIEKLLNPMLMWDELFPHEDTGSRIYTKFVTNTYSHSTDPKKRYAPKWEPGAEMPRVTVTPPTMASGTLASFAESFDITDDIQFSTAKYDPLLETKEAVAFWLAEDMNLQVMEALCPTSASEWVTASGSVTAVAANAQIMSHVTSNFGTQNTTGILAGEIDAAHDWDGNDPNPVRDIIDLKTVFNGQDGYQYKATDVYLKDVDMALLETYLTDIDANWAPSPLGNGYITSKIAGITFHEVGYESGFPSGTGNADGWVLMLDRNHPPMTIYETFYTNHPRTKLFNYYVKEGSPDVPTQYQFFGLRQPDLRRPKAAAVLRIKT